MLAFMRIAICEDEEIMAKEIWKFFFDIQDIEAKYFLDPHSFLRAYRDGEHFDIILCDAVMEPMDGITLCKNIRDIDPDVYIVFITNYIDYAPKGYEIGLFRYLLKPVTKEDILKVVGEIRQDAAKTSHIIAKTPTGSAIISFADIYYIEIRDKESHIYYDDAVAVADCSLSELEKQLNTNMFFRIHRKYLVNLEHVKEFNRHELMIDNGTMLPISYRKSKEFRSALYQFLGNAT